MMRKESNPIFRMDLPTTSTAKKCCCCYCFWGWWCYVFRPSVGLRYTASIPPLHSSLDYFQHCCHCCARDAASFINRKGDWVVAMLLRNWKRDRVMLKKRDRFHERQTSSSRIDQHAPTEEVTRSVPHFPKFPLLWGVQRFMDFHW